MNIPPNFLETTMPVNKEKEGHEAFRKNKGKTSFGDVDLKQYEGTTEVYEKRHGKMRKVIKQGNEQKRRQ
jgi:hypothetical protein